MPREGGAGTFGTIHTVIRENTERKSLEELAAKGKQNFRVMSGSRVLRIIETLVDDAIQRGASEIAQEHRDSIVKQILIQRLIGQPKEPGEPIRFCIPAPFIDTENDTVYHEGILGGILSKLGFSPKAMNEGHAVVYAELAENAFTGIGISCGGGMFNVCIAYKTIPAVTFSISRRSWRRRPFRSRWRPCDGPRTR